MSFTVEKDVMVAMRDGVELATDAWIPSVTPAPTLLVRLPYGKDLPQLLAYGLVPNVFALVEAGYAVVYQDCRGTWRSGGEFVPMLNEPNDGADTVAWLLAPALVRWQHRQLRAVLPGLHAVGERVRGRAGEGDRPGRDHDRLLHDAVVLRGRRGLLAHAPVVEHPDGHGRDAAPARPGLRRPAAAGRADRR